MAQDRRAARRGAVWGVGIGALVIVAGAAFWWWGAARTGRQPGADTEVVGVQRVVRATTPSKIELPESAPPEESAPDESEGVPFPDAEGVDMTKGWDNVDMEEVRAAMPDNLYWKLSLPTEDPNVIEERAAERARWNVEYGKVLSGTGSDEEIRAYFDRQARLFGDYIEFTTYLLDHYREQIPERDIGLLELARRLNQARLEEIPRKVEEALERKRQQDEARRAWLAEEAEFRTGETSPQ